jgi:hypothetical protein
MLARKKGKRGDDMHQLLGTYLKINNLTFFDFFSKPKFKFFFFFFNKHILSLTLKVYKSLVWAQEITEYWPLLW